MKAVTYSERKKFKRCRRAWWLAYYRRLGLKQEENVSAASLGTRVHAGLQIIYTPGDERDPLVMLEEWLEADLDADPGNVKLKKQGELARTMVEGYLQWLEETGSDEDLRIISAEEAISTPLVLPSGETVLLLMKLDVRMERQSDGAVIFMDHKTVQSFSELEALAALNEQMKTYHVGEALHDPSRRTDGAIFNMLRKVGRGPTAKPPFYGRLDVHHNVHVRRAYYTQMVGEIEEIRRTEERLDAGENPIVVVPPNSTRDCTWDCPFLPVCPMFDDASMNPERVIHSYYSEVDPLARYNAEETA